MDASHLLIILSEQEALRLGLNSISVDIPTTLSKITLEKLNKVGANIVGIILNKFKPENNNYYSYYSYYGYYDEEKKGLKRLFHFKKHKKHKKHKK